MHVGIITPDVIGARMAGPAIRAVELGRALATEHTVMVASIAGADAIEPHVRPGALDRASAVTLLRGLDAVIMQGIVATQLHDVLPDDVVVVSDLYDPYQLEGLERHRHLPLDARLDRLANAHRDVRHHLCRGDLFLCASDRQRDFWLGQLDQVGRINPLTYEADPTFESFLLLVPFGSPEQPPVRTGPGLRDMVADIDGSSRVVLWSGGVYEWFDPVVAVEAVAKLRDEIPELRLVFMGVDHPHPGVERMPVIGRLEERARDLGVLGREVILRPGWLPYGERHNVLLDADVAISTHHAHIETAFSYRTRVVDHLWAGLPSVLTDGDDLAASVAAAGAGVVVPPGDADAIADALRGLLTDESARSAAAEAARELAVTTRWSVVARPLLDALRDPRRAPDLVDPRTASRIRSHLPAMPSRGARELALARRHLAEGGLLRVIRAALARVRRRLRLPRLRP
jgi:glycosyltransferase involved in cell wall biosynthesis